MNFGLTPNFNDYLQTGIGLIPISVVLSGVGLIAGWLLRNRGPMWQSMAYRSAIACLLVAVIITAAVSGRIPNRFSMVQPDMAQAWMPINEPAGIQTHAGSSDEPVKFPTLTGASNIHKMDAGTPAMPAAADNIPEGRIVRPIGYAERYGISELFTPAALIGVYLFGFAFGLVWLIAGVVSLARLNAQAKDIDDAALMVQVSSLSACLNVASPRVIVSDSIDGPFLTGIWNPVIYLPTDYADLYDRQTLRAIIEHELAHLANRDCLFLYLSRLCLLLFWPNPLVWLLHKRLDLVSEEICDATVVTLDCSPAEYANSLLSLAERLRPTAYAFGIGVVPIKSTLGKRIKAILAENPVVMLSAKAKRAAAAMSFCIVLIAVIALCPSGTTPIGEYPEHYADNFTLAKRMGWNMGPVYIRNCIFKNESETRVINKSELKGVIVEPVLNIDYCKQVYFSLEKIPPDIGKLLVQKQLKDNPNNYYYEYRMAVYCAEHSDLPNYNYWVNKSLRHAPSILAGKILFENGQPAKNFMFHIELLNGPVPMPGKMSYWIKYAAMTDSNGCYYVPIINQSY